MKRPHRLLRALSAVVAILLSAWAAAALYLDFPFGAWRIPLAVLYAAFTVVLFIFVKRSGYRVLAAALGFLIVLSWWLSLKPSNSRPWEADQAQTPWAETAGQSITIHNVRNCDYRAEFDYTCQWETRTYDLDRLRGIDLFMTFWGSPWIAHPIVSFDFGDGQHSAFSIETRREIGETYSTVRGFFRQYELIYVVADERDLVRLRTNYRKGENVYLYHTNAGPKLTQELFRDYVARANQLHQKPEWYNALTSNCSTNIVSQPGLNDRPWDWRYLLNGKADRMEYERGDLAGGLPFDELKRRALINPVAQQADQDPQFSQRIRQGRPGF